MYLNLETGVLTRQSAAERPAAAAAAAAAIAPSVKQRRLQQQQAGRTGQCVNTRALPIILTISEGTTSKRAPGIGGALKQTCLMPVL